MGWEWLFLGKIRCGANKCLLELFNFQPKYLNISSPKLRLGEIIWYKLL